MSQLIKICLQQFLGDGSHPCHDLRKGVVFDFQEKSICVEGDFRGFINDERGHKYASMVEGSGGMKPCRLCADCYNFRFKGFPDPTGWAKFSSSPYFEDFTLYTNAQMRAMQRRLKRAVLENDPSSNC